jgi:hypothetical protein
VANKYTRKSQVKKPDEFVSFWQKAYDKAAPYGRAIGLTILGGLVVVIAAWGFDHFASGKRQDATDAFGRAVRIAEGELITDENPAKPDTDKVARFKTEKDRSEAVLAELDKIDQGSDVALRSQLFRAGVLYDLGRFADAEAAYKKYLDKSSADDPLRFLAREGVGLCAEGAGRLDDALAAFRDLEPKNGDFYRDQALYDQGRVLTKKGDAKGAEAVYKDLLAKSPQTPLRDEVATRLTAMGATVPPAPPPPGGLQLPPGLMMGGG